MDDSHGSHPTPQGSGGAVPRPDRSPTEPDDSDGEGEPDPESPGDADEPDEDGWLPL